MHSKGQGKMRRDTNDEKKIANKYKVDDELFIYDNLSSDFIHS